MTRFAELHRSIRNARKVLKTTSTQSRIDRANRAIAIARAEISRENERQRA